MTDIDSPYAGTHAGTHAGPHGGGAPETPERAPLGTIRSTGLCMVLVLVTFGIYAWVWYYRVHDEMKRHSGKGIGGLPALLTSMFVGLLLPLMPYVSAEEVGKLYQRAGRPAPVTALTGLWYFPGLFLLVGPIVWFVKTNGALNEYWRSQGAVG